MSGAVLVSVVLLSWPSFLLHYHAMKLNYYITPNVQLSSPTPRPLPVFPAHIFLCHSHNLNAWIRLGESLCTFLKHAIYSDKKTEAFTRNIWHMVMTSEHAYLTIIPRVRMGSESIAHEAEGRTGYWLRGHEGERNNCFSKIQLVGQKYRE